MGFQKQVGKHVLRKVVVPGIVLYLSMVAVGLLLSFPLKHLLKPEDEVNRDLAEGRTPDWSATTGIISRLADTASIIALLLVFALLLRWIFRRWAEAVTLMTAVLLQATVFLLTALVIDRQRPAVPQLDEAPPTSSFPSGHTGAAVALISVLVAVPFLVAAARMYRGMHHPSDVFFGAVNGIACLTIAVRAFLTTRGPAFVLRQRQPSRYSEPSPQR
jgi:undecaprenyl-diphosphatase